MRASTYLAATVAVLLAVAAVQPAQADVSADELNNIKAKLSKQTAAFAAKFVAHQQHETFDVRGRFLAEHSAGSGPTCDLMKTSVDCSKKSAADCTGKCGKQDDGCGLSDASAMSALMATGTQDMLAILFTCMRDDACTNKNCTKGDTCGASAAAVEASIPNDPVMGKLMSLQAKCSIYDKEASCNAAEGCNYDQMACGPAEAAGENLARFIMKECGFSMADLSGAATSSISPPPSPPSPPPQPPQLPPPPKTALLSRYAVDVDLPQNLGNFFIIHYLGVAFRLWMVSRKTDASTEGVFMYFIMLHLGIVAPFLEIAPNVVKGKRKELVAAIDLSERSHGALLSTATVIMSWVTTFALMHYLDKGGLCLYDFAGSKWESKLKETSANDFDDIETEPNHWWNYAYFFSLMLLYAGGVTLAEAIRVIFDFVELDNDAGNNRVADSELSDRGADAGNDSASNGATDDGDSSDNRKGGKYDAFAWKLVKAALLFALSLVPQVGTTILPRFTDEARRYETDYCPGEHQLHATSFKMRDTKCAEIAAEDRYRREKDWDFGKRRYENICGDYLRNRLTGKCYWCDDFVTDYSSDKCSGFTGEAPPDEFLRPDWKCVPGLGGIIAHPHFEAFAVMAGWSFSVIVGAYLFNLGALKDTPLNPPGPDDNEAGENNMLPGNENDLLLAAFIAPMKIAQLYGKAFSGGNYLLFTWLVLFPLVTFLVIVGLKAEGFWGDFAASFTLSMEVPDLNIRGPGMFNIGLYVYGMCVLSRVVVMIGCQLTRWRLQLAEMRSMNA